MDVKNKRGVILFPVVSSQGITFEEFRSFFQFLNNLEDFTIAMQMYNFANRSVGQGEDSQRFKVFLVFILF